MIEVPLSVRAGMPKNPNFPNLQTQLRNVDKLSRTDYSFARVQQILADVIHRQVPSELTDKLGLLSLDWHLIADPNAQDFLLCGTKGREEAASNRELIDGAVGTIVLSRWLDGQNYTYFDWHLRVAGIYQDGLQDSRIVAVQYDLQPNTPGRINISLNPAELSLVKDDMMVSYALKSLPTDDNYAWCTAGYITSGMCKQLGGKKAMEALNVYSGTSGDAGLDVHFFTNPGFRIHVDFKNNQDVVEFKPPASLGLSSWMVALPRRLENLPVRA